MNFKQVAVGIEDLNLSTNRQSGLYQQPSIVLEIYFDPKNPNQVKHNRREIAAYLGGNWRKEPDRVRNLIPTIMASKDQFEYKLACAAALISMTANTKPDKRPHGYDWQFYLPKPSQFGLVPGHQVRNRTLYNGKDRPVVPTEAGDLIATNEEKYGNGTYGNVKTAKIGSTAFAVKRVNLHWDKDRPVDYDLFLQTVIEAYTSQIIGKQSNHICSPLHFYVYDDGKPKKDTHDESVRVSKFAIQMPVGASGQQVAESTQYSLTQKLKFMAELAEGLRDMHNAGFVHNDFKLANSILINGTGQLIDFGLVVRMDSPCLAQTDVLGGTYPPPEAISVRNQQAIPNGFDFTKIDVFGFGTALSLLLAYITLERVKGQHQLKLTGSARKILNRVSGHLSEELIPVYNLASKCIHKKPQQRPTMEMVLDELQALIKTTSHSG